MAHSLGGYWKRPWIIAILERLGGLVGGGYLLLLLLLLIVLLLVRILLFDCSNLWSGIPAHTGEMPFSVAECTFCSLCWAIVGWWPVLTATITLVIPSLTPASCAGRPSTWSSSTLPKFRSASRTNCVSWLCFDLLGRERFVRFCCFGAPFV